MEPKFKVGDVVHIKSGGPKMTINKVLTRRYVSYGTRRHISLGISDEFDGEYECLWFDNSEAKKGNYSEEALVLAV